MASRSIDQQEFDRRILEEYPYFLSVAYARLLRAEGWQERVQAVVRLYELGVRVLVLVVVGQYLLRDRRRVEDERLNRMLEEEFFRRTTFGIWQQILFAAMDAYRDARDIFFIPELYDLFWDRGEERPRGRKETREHLEALLRARNIYMGAGRPEDEKGWRQLYEESLEHLRAVLEGFSFLVRYDLIRVTEAVKGEYRYERYTGLEIGRGEAELGGGEQVEEGNFYLRERESGAILKLYPLTLSWLLEKPLAEVKGTSAEAALYKSLRGNRATYLLPVMLADRQTEEEVDEIVKLLLLVQRAREEWAEAPALTWELLVEGLERITEEQVGEGEGKYDRELYLERKGVKEAFEEFLWGEKRGFVLTGKSGVGKSNFLLALRDEYREGGADVCMMVYNGANLRVEEGLLERLGQDLGRVLGVRRLERVLQRIGEIEGIEGRRVVLAVDAVNEHREPAVVMRRVNEVVRETRKPWLKVVVTSRPEAWRAIRRELKGTLVEEHYYRRRGEYRLGVELERFTYREPWVKMEPFEGGELPQVYEKYRAVYGLKTRYEELTERMRQVMRDPLMLRLVAKIYAGERVPADVRVGEIYEDYVNMLVESGRLEKADVRFLERELVPLMVEKGRYGNAVTAEQVDREKTSDGRELFDLIHDIGVGSSGRRVNQGFRNLVDAEILALRGGELDYRIEFAYERFYEYFVGKRLKELVGKNGKRVEEYIRLVGETEVRPYLWGAVRTAILREEGKGRLLRELAEEEDDRVKEMVVDCLVEMGKETVKGRGERRWGCER